MNGHLIPIIPDDIWTQRVLNMPPLLVADYRNELTRLGRFEDACGESPRGDIGGIDEAATHDHFAFRFAASSVRTEYVLLDPLSEFRPLSLQLQNSFADGRLSLLDIPCGAGAGILGFLDLLTHLRSRNLVVRLPLDIMVTAGDISPFARDLYCRMLDNAIPRLGAQGIRLQWQCLEWDATQESTTAALVDAWFRQSPLSEEWLVLTAAFSGEAARSSELAAAIERSLRHIAARLHDRLGTLFWIEPNSNDSNAFFRRLQEIFASGFQRWFSPSTSMAGLFRWQHPFRPITPNGRVRIMRHESTGL